MTKYRIYVSVEEWNEDKNGFIRYQAVEETIESSMIPTIHSKILDRNIEVYF